MKALGDRPSFDELQQDARSTWQEAQNRRKLTAWIVEDLRKQPWRCSSCGRQNDPKDTICPSCRSARIFEVDR